MRPVAQKPSNDKFCDWGDAGNDQDERNTYVDLKPVVIMHDDVNTGFTKKRRFRHGGINVLPWSQMAGAEGGGDGGGGGSGGVGWGRQRAALGSWLRPRVHRNTAP